MLTFFFDCGPNMGPLNRSILLDCDHFIVPAACDEFSIRAIRTLGHTLKNWILQWGDISDLAPDGTYLLPGKPQFLGYIPQQYRIYGGNITQEFSRFLARIDRQVQEDIVGPLRAINPRLVARSKSYELGHVQNLSSLVSVAQREQLPLWQASVGSPELRESAHNQFGLLADRLIELTGGRVNG
jgi:hypothetical protein